MSEDRMKPDPPPLDLANRLALRLVEAAQALGVSEGKLREMLPRLPVVRDGRTVLLPVAGLRQWLEEEADAERRCADRVTAEILHQIDKG